MLAQGGDAGGAQGQPEIAELGGQGPVFGGLAGVAAGEQPGAGVVGGDVVVAAGGELVQLRVERRGDGAGRVTQPQRRGGGEPGCSRARVAISCAGVTPRMSHSAASTGSDSRSGTWVTSHHTCTDDSVMPRSASSGSRSDALNSPAAAITSRSRHW